MPPVLVEYREHVVQGDLPASVLAVAELAVRAVGDDSVEPGSKGRLAPERVDLLDHRQERILDDLLGVLGIGRDPDGQAIRPVLIGCDETLGGARLAVAQGFHEPLVTIPRYDVECPSVHRVLPHRFALRIIGPRSPRRSRYARTRGS